MSLGEPRKYVTIFLEAHGSGPWPCAYCDDMVEVLGTRSDFGVVHHIDEDRKNNNISNLAMMHAGCHLKHHRTGVKRDPASIAKTVAKRMANGYTHTAETRRKIGDGNRGKPGCKSMLGRHHTEETKLKMRTSPRKSRERLQCPYCPMITEPGPMRSHMKFKHKEHEDA